MARPEPARVFLVLDPATCTGWCTVRVAADGASADIFAYGIIDVENKSSAFQGDQCIALMKAVDNLLTEHLVTEVAVEDYFFSKKFCSGGTMNAALRTAIHIMTRVRGLPYHILNISQWKTFVAGRSIPTKPQIAQWGKAAANKFYIQEALYSRYGFRFPNWLPHPQKAGKMITFRSDVVDAVAQALYFSSFIHHIPRVTMSVVTPPDHAAYLKQKRCYHYA